MNKRQQKKALKKFFNSERFGDFMKASTFQFETPVLNTLMGDEPYKFKETWGPVLEKWKRNSEP